VNGKIATDKTLIKRLDSMYIPPAYKDIVIAKSANNKIQAIGVDKRGRKQYMYNQSFIAKRNDRKYDDILELGKKIVSIETDNNTAINTIAGKSYNQLNLPDDYIPIIIYMLRKYHFRIGSEKYTTENNSHGITTLQPRHIKFHSPSKFTIEFIGKKGILNRYSDDNEKMANIFKMLIKQSPNTNSTRLNNTNNPKNNFIFAYKTPSTNESSIINADAIQTYFQDKYNSYITPKMFRTWYGNYHMLEHLRDMYNTDKLSYRMGNSDVRDVITKCSEYVSSKLNNTPTISKKSYIDNKLLALVMRNPYHIAAKIPDDKTEKHRFLNKMIMKLR
jgi:DNA topoisomerase-1